MNDMQELVQATKTLAGHVAAVVRASNALDGLLKDGNRDDIEPATRKALLRAAKHEHDAFREGHFRGIIAAVNSVMDLVDKLYKAEPAAPAEPGAPAAGQEAPDAPPAA